MPESVVITGDKAPDPALNQQDNPNNQQQNNTPDPNHESQNLDMKGGHAHV